MTKERMNVAKVFPTAYQPLIDLEKVNHAGPIDEQLYELIKIRASQINGCGYCLSMHHRDARKLGESQQRLDVLGAWRDVDLFTPREEAALALTEAVTLISHDGVPDDVWTLVNEHFDEKEVAALIIAITTINMWNRIAISTRQQPEPES